MDNCHSIRKESKFDRSCLINRLYNMYVCFAHQSLHFCTTSLQFHRWILSLIYKGFKQELKLSDLYRCPSKDESKYVADRLERYYHFNKLIHMHLTLANLENG